MKNLVTLSIISASLLLSGNALADRPHAHHGYSDTATVLSAKPIYKRVEVIQPAKRQCWRKKVQTHAHRHADTSYTAPLTGAIIGGVIGNQFGEGRGKDIMTVGGALVGASLAHDASSVDRHPRHRSGFVRHCETTQKVKTQRKLVGYRVKYLYDGQIHRTRMAEHPGDTIQVKVKVRPIG